MDLTQQTVLNKEMGHWYLGSSNGEEAAGEVSAMSVRRVSSTRQ